MQIEWFVYHKNTVLGPFTTNDVTSQMSSGKFDEKSVIWWKGEKDWISILVWKDTYPSIVSKIEAHYNAEWRIQTSSETTKLMSFDDCVDYLKTVELDSAQICKAGSENWERLFSNSVFLNALEMTRRKYPRVPIVATAKIAKAGSKFSYLVKVNVIGERGMGATGLTKNFPSNVPVDIRIEAANLAAPIVAEGYIIYQTPDGVSGVEFKKISAEARSIIIEYVNRFSGTAAKIASAKKKPA